MTNKRLILCIFCAICAILCSIPCLAQTQVLKYNGKAVKYGGDRNDGPIVLPTAYRAKPNEFRGIWVATHANIDFPVCKTAKEFRKQYLAIVDNLSSHGFNAIIFQARPSNDAFYKSSLNPWSVRMCGKEGLTFSDEPNFDPMAFAIAEAHRRGLEFHAWFNPYRVANQVKVSKWAHLSSLAPNNFARLHPEYVLESKATDGTRLLFLNPGEPQVIRFLLATIREFVQKYDADAIHFDDYFYPYTDMGNTDNYTFAKNNPTRLPLDYWRRNNVNTLIYGVSTLLKELNKGRKRPVKFGISPFGIWANSPNLKRLVQQDGKPVQSMPGGSLTNGSQSYFNIYADTRLWVKKKWIDYVAPQLYWGFSHPDAPYAALADWWSDTVHGTDVKLYIGHAPYRMAQPHSDFANQDEIRNQLLFNSANKDISGSIFFSYSKIFLSNNKRLQTVLNQLTALYNAKGK